MNVKAIAFDLDDTLLRSDLTISDRTLRALRRAHDAGIHILPASGRTRDSMRRFVEQIGCASLFISCNGAEVWSPTGKPMMQQLLDVPIAQEIARFGAAHGCYAQTYAGDCFYFNQQGYWADSYAQSSMLHGVYVGNLEQFLTAPTPKILMMAQPDSVAAMLREAQAQFAGRLSITCSKPYFLEFNPLRATKGNALRWCGERLGFTLEETAAFGDSLNDLSMLEAAGCGVAMGNARDDVKARLPRHCASNDEDGVAAYIETHFLHGMEVPSDDSGR